MQPQPQRQGADGGLVLRVAELLGPGGEAGKRGAGALAAGGGAAEPRGDQAGALLRPAGALAEQAAAERGPSQAVSQPRGGGRGAVQARPDAGQLLGTVGALCGESRPSRRRGAARRASGAGPITARTPGCAAIRRCQRLSSASRSPVVIGPDSVAATRTKGASQPGPIAGSIVSALWRAGLAAGQLVDPRRAGPEGERRRGEQGQRDRDRDRGAAGTAQRGAGGGGDPRAPARPRPRADPDRVDPRSPSRASSPGSAATAMTTLIAVTTAAAVAIESSSEPGCRKAERTIAMRKVEPAKTVVRPALRRVRSAAVGGLRPAASSSRKRETISSE